MLALGLSAGFVSCKPDQEKPEPPKDETKLEFQQTEVTVSPDGGEGSVLYTITNPVEGATLTATSDQTWVHDFTVTDKAINFIADANDDAAREATVTVKYTEEVSATFKVKQPESEAPFQVTIPEETITETSAIVNVYPKDKEMGYVMLSIAKDYYDTMDETQIIAEIKALYESYAAYYEVSLEEFMTQNEILEYGDLENAQFTGLDPDSENYILTVGMNTSCEAQSELVATYFRTKAVEKIDMDFTFEFIVDGPYVTMNVEATPEDEYFYFDAVDPVALEESGISVDEAIEQIIAQNIEFGAIFGMSPEDMVKALCSLGFGTYDFELEAEKEYIGAAAGVSLAGLVITDAATENFTTGAVQPSDNQITLEIVSVNVDRAALKVTTTNEDPYGLVIAEQADYAGMDDDAILEALVSDENVYINEVAGNWEGNVTGLDPETDYVIYAFGYLAGTATTGLSSVEFTTIKAGDPKEFTFTSEARDLTSAGATVVVNGSPETVLYYFDLATPDKTEADLKANLDAVIQQNIDYGVIPDRISYFKQKGSRGTDEYSYQLDSETEYVIWAVSIDETTGDYVVFDFGERFTTPAKEVSQVTVSASHDKYFDADALAEAYPGEYDDFTGQGLYCLPVTIETSEPVQGVLQVVFQGNLMDETEYTDDLLIQNLESKGNPNTMLYWFLPYDMELTLVAVAMDNNGNYTKVYRELINKSKDGVSDVADFPEPEGVSRSNVFFQVDAFGFRSMKAYDVQPVAPQAVLPEINARTSVSAERALGLREVDMQNLEIKERPMDRTIRTYRQF